MSRNRAAVIGLLVALVGCSAPSPTPSPAAPSEAERSASPTTAASGDSDATPPPSSPSAAGEPPELTIETVAEGLASPISIATAPGGWLLVNEQAGRVVAVHPDQGELVEVVDLRDRILSGGERGLLGVALHPDWPEDARAWVHYTASDTDAIVAELSGTQEGDGAPALDAGSERILIELPDPFGNHNGGQLAFGPDGHLWIGLGDGGSGGDPLGNGQNPATLLGSILRIEVAPTAESGGYAVPADNPFADGAAGAPEVYLFGLRNPWRFSFDPETDQLWIADVGQNAYEEIDRLDPASSAGANLGWNRMEATRCFESASCDTDGLVLPLAEYGRDLGCSVTGGHVYRGSRIADLAGWYVFGDYCTGLLLAVPADADAPTDGSALAPRILGETGASLSSFGVDTAGELYVVDHAGGVLSRIVPAGG